MSTSTQIIHIHRKSKQGSHWLKLFQLCGNNWNDTENIKNKNKKKKGRERRAQWWCRGKLRPIYRVLSPDAAVTGSSPSLLILATCLPSLTTYFPVNSPSNKVHFRQFSLKESQEIWNLSVFGKHSSLCADQYQVVLHYLMAFGKFFKYQRIRKLYKWCKFGFSSKGIVHKTYLRKLELFFFKVNVTFILESNWKTTERTGDKKE